MTAETTLRERVALALTRRHFAGTGCGVSPDSPSACSHCHGPSPMTSREVADAVLAVLTADDVVREWAGVLAGHLVTTADAGWLWCQCGAVLFDPKAGALVGGAWPPGLQVGTAAHLAHQVEALRDHIRGLG